MNKIKVILALALIGVFCCNFFLPKAMYQEKIALVFLSQVAVAVQNIHRVRLSGILLAGNVGEVAARANTDIAFIVDFNQPKTSLSKVLL